MTRPVSADELAAALRNGKSREEAISALGARAADDIKAMDREFGWDAHEFSSVYELAARAFEDGMTFASEWADAGTNEAVRSSAEALVIAFRRHCIVTYGAPPSEDDFRAILETAALPQPPDAGEGLDVEGLRHEIEAELELVPRKKRPQFDAGAAAAYNWVLSLLPPPALSPVKERDDG